MPSYRLILTVANVFPGTDPSQVLPLAARALGKHANVESFDLKITRNSPQLVLRYTCADKAEAKTCAYRAELEISGFIEVTRAQTLQRVHNRWEYI